MKSRGGLLLIVALLVILSSVAPAGAAPPIGLRASIDNRDVSTMDTNNPLRLVPDQTIVVTVAVANRTGRDLTVRSVNLNGRVMGLTFYSFETRIDLVVAPGATESRTFAVELIGLKGEATGLLPGRLDLLDQHRNVILGESLATDVRGSLGSVYGAFGVLIAIITMLLFGGAAIRLATHRMSVHRWSRGARFGTAGLGLGLTLTFSLSAFRILLPNPGSWLTIVLVSAIGLFALGYITPTPSIYFADDEGEDDQGAGRDVRPRVASASP